MKFNALLVSAAMMVMTLAACGDDDPVNPDNNQGGNEDTETVEGDVEGTWKANSIILVSGHITVPAGKSLTIEEGVQVIFDDKGCVITLPSTCPDLVDAVLVVELEGTPVVIS